MFFSLLVKVAEKLHKSMCESTTKIIFVLSKSWLTDDKSQDAEEGKNQNWNEIILPAECLW